MTDFKIEKIAPLCADFGVTLDSEKINLLNLYGNLLLLWNEKNKPYRHYRARRGAL